MYKEKILKELERFPETMMPRLYRVIHLLSTELLGAWVKTTRKCGSLKGIWKGSQIDESLFVDAKKSLFP